MHFTGRTWRPPYEAHSVIIQATSGCTYQQCRFCNLYQNERFRMSPMEEFEEDLAELSAECPQDILDGGKPFFHELPEFEIEGINGAGLSD